MRAITGFVTSAGTLIIRPVDQGRPQGKLRGEGYIFFDPHSLFNRVMKDHLYVMCSVGETLPYNKYTLANANRDFDTWSKEV